MTEGIERAVAAGAPPGRVGVLVVMGVSGVGKTTVAKALARRWRAAFADGDDFHPPQNVAKMTAGIPLTDADRGPWLEAIAAWIDARRRAGERGVVACSALKRAYRDVLVVGRPDVGLVFLRGAKGLIVGRLEGRRDHYMPPSLLDSQLATLEPPGPDENPIVVDAARPPAWIVDAVLSTLGA